MGVLIRSGSRGNETWRNLSSAARLSPRDPWLCVPGLLRVCSFRRKSYSPTIGVVC